MHGFDRMGYGVPIDKCEREEGRAGGEGGRHEKGGEFGPGKNGWVEGREFSLSLSLFTV